MGNLASPSIHCEDKTFQLLPSQNFASLSQSLSLDYIADENTFMHNTIICAWIFSRGD